ncbi:hypothetical protein NL676_036028 [Syzygium grande]|nr:hypothetical protein NL676_036028 [Syzygium grande]
MDSLVSWFEPIPIALFMANGLLLRLPFSGDKMIGREEDWRKKTIGSNQPDRGGTAEENFGSGPWVGGELRPAEVVAAGGRWGKS